MFSKDASAGKTKKGEDKNTKGLKIVEFSDARLEGLIGSNLYEQLVEDIELLDELGAELDLQKVHDGQLTPVFFGSGGNNFGVKLFLDTFLGYSTKPRKRTTRDGSVLHPTDENFCGFVFKLQANMDPRHRDKVAFVRVVSGRFERGMKVTNARTKKQVALSRPSALFGQDKTVLDVGFAGDIIGLNNPGSFEIGDTLYMGGSQRELPSIPTFTPELFAYLRCVLRVTKSQNGLPIQDINHFSFAITEIATPGSTSSSRKVSPSCSARAPCRCVLRVSQIRQRTVCPYKTLTTFLLQVMYSRDAIKQDPILAAVGGLQFEVVQHRMKQEYGVETTLDPLAFSVARGVVGGWDSVDAAGRIFNAQCVKDQVRICTYHPASLIAHTRR